MEHSSHLPGWEEYRAMSREEKTALAKAIGTETGMDYKGIVRYSRWGMELETALYQKEGAEFVFLPGKRTELGWNGLPEQPEESGFLAALEQDILEYWGGQYQPEEILRLLTTPRRTVTIPPLLAERIPRSCENSSVIPLDELSEAGQKAVAQLQSNPRSRCMIFDSFEPGNPKLRLTRLKSGEIQAEILRPESPAELRRRLEQEGFTLPDGDLWEYLCGGENGALFPWGDRLPEAEELSWRENGFGLRIGYDHEGYRREVIRDCPWPFRGGDGGELACYGTLPALGPVVGSAHFLGWFGSSWDENRESIEMLLMDGLDGEYDFFRRILLLG